LEEKKKRYTSNTQRKPANNHGSGPIRRGNKKRIVRGSNKSVPTRGTKKIGQGRTGGKGGKEKERKGGGKQIGSPSRISA